MVDFDEHMAPRLDKIFQPPQVGKAFFQGCADLLGLVILYADDRDSGFFHVPIISKKGIKGENPGRFITEKPCECPRAIR